MEGWLGEVKSEKEGWLKDGAIEERCYLAEGDSPLGFRVALLGLPDLQISVKSELGNTGREDANRELMRDSRSALRESKQKMEKMSGHNNSQA